MAKAKRERDSIKGGKHVNANVNANANLLPRLHPEEPTGDAEAAHSAHANCNDILIRQQLSCPIQWVTQQRNLSPEAVVETNLWGTSLKVVIKRWPGRIHAFCVLNNKTNRN